MKLQRTTTTEEIQRSFSEQFPMLKLEFYNKEHRAFSGSKEEHRITEPATMEALNDEFRPGEIEISDKLRVEELESQFESKFGLHVQLFRKSGEQWMQTSITDSWTLRKQEDSSERQQGFSRRADGK